MSVQHHAPAALYPRVRPGTHFYRRLFGPQGRSGRAENFVPTGIRSRTDQPVAQSLYRLSYPTHLYNMYRVLFSGVKGPERDVDNPPPSSKVTQSLCRSVTVPEGSRWLSPPDFISRNMMVVRLSSIRTVRLYPPPSKYSWYSFLLEVCFYPHFGSEKLVFPRVCFRFGIAWLRACNAVNLRG